MPADRQDETRPLQRLRLYNGALGLLHLAQGVLILIISNDFALPLTTSFLRFDPMTASPQPFIDQVGTLRLGPLVALFLFLAAADHLLVAAPRIFDWYAANLSRGVNYARWMEYSFSASIMIVLIAMLSGMYDIPGLVLLFCLNATMILFGLLMERRNAAGERTDWMPFVFGCLAGIVPWIIIAVYFGSAAADSSNGVPKFVYGIVFSLFIFFNSFALNMYLQYRRVGPWRDYLFGEKMYLLLSLLAKSALAWQVFAGTLRR